MNIENYISQRKRGFIMKHNTPKELLNAHQVVKMPKHISHRKTVILTTILTSTAIIDFLSFSIKGAQLALSYGYNLIALIFIICYYLRNVLRSSITMFTDTQKNAFRTEQSAYIIENVSNMSNCVRGKVFVKNGDFARIVTNSEIILTLKEYISYVWAFLEKLPITIANIITSILMILAIFATEFFQTKNLQLTVLLSSIVFICIIIFSILYVVRFKIIKSFKYEYKELKKQNEVLFNDIRNIEPLIKPEFSYRADLLVSNMDAQRKNEKNKVSKLNSVEIIRAFVLAIFMIIIIVIKLYYAGGINNLTLLVLTDILAISSVYSNLLNKVVQILQSIEELANTLKDAESLKLDFDNITNIYEDEMKVKVAKEKIIENIKVMPFNFTYPGKNSVYELENKTVFSLERGKSYLVYGHTGCGKSTFMHLLTGKLRIEKTPSPISYGDAKLAYLSSIMHESNGKLGSNRVLEELIFNQDLNTLNYNKMIEILKGTNIYYDILRNLGLKTPDNKLVLDYLKNTYIDQYSSGQKQRLAIVKVLYNLNSEHKIVVFDEATNALDDDTAKSVLSFMADYCQRDSLRIVFFVTHQIEITKEITDGSITFEQKNFPIFEVTPKV